MSGLNIKNGKTILFNQLKDVGNEIDIAIKDNYSYSINLRCIVCGMKNILIAMKIIHLNKMAIEANKFLN